MSRIPIFDGHNDTVHQIRNGTRSFYQRSELGHLDLPRADEGGMIGGCFAIFCPDPDEELSADQRNEKQKFPSPPLDFSWAYDQMVDQLFWLYRIAGDSDNEVAIVRSASDIRRNMEKNVFSIEIHLEGADSIDDDLATLDWLYMAGLRSLGIVWSRPNHFGTGVATRRSGSPDIGPGLTDLGKELVRTCNQMGIMVDVSHLNEAGFWDVASITDRPIVASHSNANALAPAVRNLTDKQLDAVRESNGLVGINFHCGFLRKDGFSPVADTSLTRIADHLVYIADRVGIDGVTLGSDFDGAMMPGDLKDAAGLPRLIDELRTRGFDDESLRKIGYENWLRIFDATWI